MPVDDAARPSDPVADILRQLRDKDAIGRDTGLQRLRAGIAVDIRVLVLPEAKDLVGLGRGDASGGVLPGDDLAGERFGVAQARGQVVVVVVEAHVEGGAVGGDAGDGVQGGVEGRRGGEVREPGGRLRGHAVGGAEGGGGGAGVGGLEGVDGGGLDGEKEVVGGLVHGVYEHAGDLAGDDVVGDAVGEGGVGGGGEEVEEGVVDGEEVEAMLVAVV